jgi:hypothetical protein
LAQYNFFTSFLTFTQFYGGGFYLGEKVFGASTMLFKTSQAFFAIDAANCIKVVELGLELTLKLVNQACTINGSFTKCAFKILLSS